MYSLLIAAIINIKHYFLKQEEITGDFLLYGEKIPSLKSNAKKQK